MAIADNDVVVAIIAAGSAISVTAIGVWQSKRSEARSEARDTDEILVSGMTYLITNLRTDNAEMRERLEQLEVCIQERIQLRHRVAELEAAASDEGKRQ